MNKQIGSSTAVLAKLDRNTLKTTNLGDSGYYVLRPDDDKVAQVFKSKEQQYSFNFPYQCGTGADLPYNAFDNQHEILENDIIVMASDGMLDNLYDEHVLDCVKPLLKDSYL